MRRLSSLFFRKNAAISITNTNGTEIGAIRTRTIKPITAVIIDIAVPNPVNNKSPAANSISSPGMAKIIVAMIAVKAMMRMPNIFNNTSKITPIINNPARVAKALTIFSPFPLYRLKLLKSLL